jgi:hypothetical protein
MTILEKFGLRVKELRLAKELSREKLGPFNKTACHCEAFSRKKSIRIKAVAIFRCVFMGSVPLRDTAEDCYG